LKKLFLILIMIISTCITAYTIIFWQPSDKFMAKNLIQQQEYENSNNKSNEDVNRVKYEKNKEEKLYEEREEDNESDIDTLKSEVDKGLDIAVQGNVLRVDEEGLEKTIPREKKEKVEVIIKKLSSIDLINLKEKFNKKNNVEGFREGFALIKRRVSDKEYEEIKKILEEYIYFDVLEEKI